MILRWKNRIVHKMTGVLMFAFSTLLLSSCGDDIAGGGTETSNGNVIATVSGNSITFNAKEGTVLGLFDTGYVGFSGQEYADSTVADTSESAAFVDLPSGNIM